MTRYRFGAFDKPPAQITDDAGMVIGTTTRKRSGSHFEVHAPDGSLLCSGDKSGLLGHKHDVVDAAGTRVVQLVSHGSTNVDIELPDGHSWTLRGTTRDRSWSVRDESDQVILESSPEGESKWSLDWDVTCSTELDLAVLIGIVETKHIIEANRPTQAQSAFSTDVLGHGGGTAP